METATFIRALGVPSNASLYRLSSPIKGSSFVVVQAVVTQWRDRETYVLLSDERGEVKDWGDFQRGSFQGSMNHELALKKAGYSLLN